LEVLGVFAKKKNNEHSNTEEIINAIGFFGKTPPFQLLCLSQIKANNAEFFGYQKNIF
jgi:hypothetical protein